MPAKVLVTGGTGRLGSVVVRGLTTAGYDCTVLSSRTAPGSPAQVSYGDLVSGKGLAGALQGKDIVVHCASDFNLHEKVDVQGTRNLVENLDRSSIPHIVYVSIVGVEDIPLAYYYSKQKAEQILMTSGVPCLILRCTQFHDFVFRMLAEFEEASRSSELFRIPAGLRFQSIALEDVSDLILAGLDKRWTGLLERGGPEMLGFEQMAEAYLRRRGIRKRLVHVEPQEELHNAFTLGKNLTSNRLETGIRWEQFLARTLK